LPRSEKCSFQRLGDPKDIVGLIFVDIVNDIAPELKKGIWCGSNTDRQSNTVKCPILWRHSGFRFHRTTNMLGFTENVSGAWQLVRKTGRIHVKQSFLEQNQNQFEKNYFDVVMTPFIENFIPYLTGEKVMPVQGDNEKKKVRFAQTYTPAQVTDVWKRFFGVIAAQMTDSFRVERQQNTNVKEKQSEIENTASSQEPKKEEQMFEDPF
ncbi:hypothetical protein COOONC_23648, partial [Cooperia oncophora]